MSSEIENLLSELDESPDVVLVRPLGVPVVEAPAALPEDVRRFYERCGSATLFPGSDYPVRILGPDEFVLTNRILWQGLSEEALKTAEGDRSWLWYAIASDEKGDYLSIDLAPQRLGRCYDSFSESHAIAGECPVVANTFTELVRRLLRNEGRYWYWLEKDFPSLGDAYD